MCGDYKLISNLEASATNNYAGSTGVVQLYDLAKDPTEQTNVFDDAAYVSHKKSRTKSEKERDCPSRRRFHWVNWWSPLVHTMGHAGVRAVR